MQQDSNQGCKVRVLVADNSPFHTQLLAGALKRDPDFEVVSSNLSAASLRTASRNQPIDVFVLSAFADGDGQRGLKVLQELREASPQLRAVVLLNASTPDSILEAFRAGAKGVFHVQEPHDLLCRCIRRVHEGEAWVSREQMTLLLEAMASKPKIRAVDGKGMNLLSKREAEVVRYLAEGLTNREIAQRIGLSQHTIKNYLFRIFDKLGVSNRIELLFMTLSHTTTAQLLLQDLMMEPADRYDDATFASCQRAAEHGVVAAQLALARMLSMGRANDRDLVKAYAWYCIAIDQVTHTKNNLKKKMSPAQLSLAELRLREWLNRSQTSEQSPATRTPYESAGRGELSDSTL